MESHKGLRLLKDIVHYRTYASTLASGRKESRAQTIARNCAMHVEKFPCWETEITEAFKEVHAGRVVPSMRSLQFAGQAIHRSNARIYNCAYTPLERLQDFYDLFFLLMNGCGVGFSVQKVHIGKLDPVCISTQHATMRIEDSKEGWCESLIALFKIPNIHFDYSLIRPSGALLSTGGTASGPEPLRSSHEKVRAILLRAEGRRLTSLECHDIVCHIADAVVVGGVRRAALISLFDHDDSEMLQCKKGAWWVENGQRARANNSAVVERGQAKFLSTLEEVLESCFENGTGEPGLSLSWDPAGQGYNPCHEIALQNRQLCNLSEVNVAACQDEQDFYRAARAASFIGTLQAAYTNLSGISADWQQNCERERLLGVSLTGLAENWGLIANSKILQKGAALLKEENALWARRLGFVPAARIGCVKPSGSTSAFLGTTSGIHAAHAPFYIRRVRIDLDDPLARRLIALYGMNPYEPGVHQVVEQDIMNSSNIVVSVPVAMERAICRKSETSVDLLQRASHVHKNWILPSHRCGKNHHNVSLTVSYQEHEKAAIISWMKSNPDSFSGISLLPHHGGNYPQLPFEEISASEYLHFSSCLKHDLDFDDVNYGKHRDTRPHEIACSGGACEYL